MSSLSDFLGGGGGVPKETIQRDFTLDITESGTIALPFAGTVDVYAIGAGGGAHMGNAGFAFNTNNTGNTRGMPFNGGGGGGCAVRQGMEVAKGDELVVVVGAGGEIVSGNGANTLEANTGVGGDTTVNTNSNNITISLTGGGGSCGGAGVNKKNGSGGTASGGDSNYTGGRGGQHAGNVNTAPHYVNYNFNAFLCGGGSAAYQADGHQGGDLEFNHTNTNNASMVYLTSGGGIGGSAANLTISGSPPALYGTGAPGGSLAGSTSTDISNSTSSYYTTPSGPAGMQGRNGNNLSDLAHPVGRGGGGRTRRFEVTGNNLTTFSSFPDAESGSGGGGEAMNMTLYNSTNNTRITIEHTGPGIFGGKGATLYNGYTYHSNNTQKEAENVFGGGAGAVASNISGYVHPDNTQKVAFYGGSGLVRIVYNAFA